jgi:osmotically-inducible protein OsmY
MNQLTRYAAIAAIAGGLVASGCAVTHGRSTPGQYVDDVTVVAKVKAELLESEHADGLDINVDSLNGDVTLRGWASSRTEANAAVAIARSVEGVKSVDNQIELKRQD